MPLNFLGSLIGGGGGLGFSSSNSNSNTAFNQNQNQNFNTNTSGSTQRTLTPYQTAIQSPIFNELRDLMLNPTAALKPYYTGARDSTNQNYSGLADMLRQQFMGSGGGESGKFGSALVQGNLQRLGDLSKVDTGFQQEAAQLPLTASNLAQQFLGMNMGETSTGKSSGASTSTTSGTSNTQTSSSGFSL